MSIVKEKIYTIPVNDAFAAESPCPLCTLQQGLEDQLLEYYLGPSLMESDVRQVTNKTGFCGAHIAKLYTSQKNRLGMGLMLHTHLQHVTGDLEKIVPRSAKGKRRGLFDRSEGSALSKAADHIRSRAESCIICERMTETMARYIEVIMWQFMNESDFKTKFNNSQGFCLMHLADLLDGADRHLRGGDQESFVTQLWNLEHGKLEELIGDVEWFTLKFDYRNTDKPWGNSKDALPQAIRRLTGDRPLS